jgi:hypothetical protein
MIVPTKVKGGVSGGGGGAATVRVGSGAAGAAGVGGRRDTEKSGRSLVADSFEIGMAHKGLPAVEVCDAGGVPRSGAAGPLKSVSIAARD